MEKPKGICPICDAEVKLNANVEESEIVSCPDCKSSLVVTKVNKNKLTFEQAPAVEEDWGE